MLLGLPEVSTITLNTEYLIHYEYRSFHVIFENYEVPFKVKGPQSSPDCLDVKRPMHQVHSLLISKGNYENDSCSNKDCPIDHLIENDSSRLCRHIVELGYHVPKQETKCNELHIFGSL